MADNGSIHTVEGELAELREEVRRLKEVQQGREGTEKKDEGPHNEDDAHQPPKSTLRHPLRNAILAVVGLAILAGGIAYWLRSRHYEDTDDAQVDGHISGIATRIAGTVIAVHVEENAPVQVGQVVVDLDRRDFQTAVDQARGELARAE
jgi:membrane fusion protein, multidrug efflux system